MNVALPEPKPEPFTFNPMRWGLPDDALHCSLLTELNYFPNIEFDAASTL